jgi:hypothetical protein
MLLLLLRVCRAAKKVVDDIAREQVIAAKISGVPPSMHLILSPNTDGDEATITTADIIAGRSYLHKVCVTACAVLCWGGGSLFTCVLRWGGSKALPSVSEINRPPDSDSCSETCARKLGACAG